VKTTFDAHDETRPFERWTISYVRRGLAAGFLRFDDARRFVEAFGDHLTLAEILSSAPVRKPAP